MAALLVTMRCRRAAYHLKTVCDFCNKMREDVF